jgi:hypothetical protein
MNPTEPPRRQLAHALAVLPDALSLATLLVALWFIFGTYEDYGIGWDEGIHVRYGDHILDWYTSGFEDDSALHFRRDYLYGGAFDALGAVTRELATIDSYDALHLFGGLIGFLGFIGVWRLGRFLGGPWGGLWSLLFVVLTPVYWGHMFFNPKDAPFAVGYVWGLYYVIRVAQELPAVSKGLWIKLGLGLAAALCVRIAGLLVVCYLLLTVATYAAFRLYLTGRPVEAGRAAWSTGWRAGTSILIGWIGMLALWPWAQLHPVWGPFHSLRNMTNFNLHNRKFPFGGDWIRTYEVPWDYLPRFFLFKMPEIVIVGMLAAAIVGLVWAVRRRKDPRATLFIYARSLLAIAIVLPWLYAVVRGSALYDGLRHFLFLAPPMCVAAGLFVAWLQKEARQRRAWMGAAVVALAMVGVGRQIAVMHHMHPLQYAWFNAFSGGLERVTGLYDTDYYGASYKEAVARLEAHLWETEPEKFLNTTYTVRACAPSGIIRRYLPNNFRYKKGGRFYMGFTRGSCHEKYSDFPEVARVERYGGLINIVRDTAPEDERSD